MLGSDSGYAKDGDRSAHYGNDVEEKHSTLTIQ